MVAVCLAEPPPWVSYRILATLSMFYCHLDHKQVNFKQISTAQHPVPQWPLIRNVHVVVHAYLDHNTFLLVCWFATPEGSDKIIEGHSCGGHIKVCTPHGSYNWLFHGRVKGWMSHNLHFTLSSGALLFELLQSCGCPVPQVSWSAAPKLKASVICHCPWDGPLHCPFSSRLQTHAFLLAFEQSLNLLFVLLLLLF